MWSPNREIDFGFGSCVPCVRARRACGRGEAKLRACAGLSPIAGGSGGSLCCCSCCSGGAVCGVVPGVVPV